jgi:AI-2 transport protein TqsA
MIMPDSVSSPTESPGRNSSVALIVCTVVLVAIALHLGRSVFAPVAVSLFAIAVAWPVQKSLQERLPQLAALAITLLLTVVVFGTLMALSLWSVGQVGRWLISNAAHLEELYAKMTGWLEQHGVYVFGVFVERFDVFWLARPFQLLASYARDLVGFSLLVIVFMMLGLLEVRVFKEKLLAIGDNDLGPRIVTVLEETAGKFRRYMVIRSAASLLTGLTVAALCWVIGVDLPYAWGVLAFVLNFIPFIGPFIATVLPALFAVAQFHSWETSVLLLAAGSAVQFMIGSYLEPRLAGSRLAMSPFLVMFSVFFTALLWGIPGAFMGVPLAIALLSIFRLSPRTAWISELFAGEKRLSPTA